MRQFDSLTFLPHENIVTPFSEKKAEFSAASASLHTRQIQPFKLSSGFHRSAFNKSDLG